METIIIQTKSKSTKKLLFELAKKLGGRAETSDKETAEDLAFGKMMEQSKTGVLVSKDSIKSQPSK